MHSISTSMKLPVIVAEDFYNKFGVEIVEAYGIIEVGLPFLNASVNRAKRGSVGKILPDYEIKIDLPDKRGVGAIFIKGPGMFDAYFSPWQLRSNVLEDGWFKTGDVGFLDDSECLFLIGRDKSVINFNGMKIFPNEVEMVLNAHPQVEESLVYGVEHSRFGQIPCAKVVLKENDHNFDHDILRKYCYNHLAKYKVPKEISYVLQLKKTASGKLIR